MNDKELREAIEDILFDWIESEVSFTNNVIASRILFLIKEKYVRLSDDQSLPENKKANPDDREDIVAYGAYNSSQYDMLKAGWRKVELDA